MLAWEVAIFGLRQLVYRSTRLSSYLSPNTVAMLRLPPGIEARASLEKRSQICLRLMDFSWLVYGVFFFAASGCGTTRSFTATDQLLMSDAVDATVSKIDFSPLAGKKVFLDTSYTKMLKAPNNLLDTDYVISSIRQGMTAEHVLLVDTKDEAELIAEARVGTMGLDGHNVTYGVPASSALSGAGALAGASIPALPEMSIGRREAKLGAAKVAVFAYVKKSHEPYWQSGIARSTSTSRDTWFLGIGPWQAGTIYDGTRFAGDRTSRIWGMPQNRVMPRGPSYEEFRGTKLFAAAVESRDKPTKPDGETQIAQAGNVPAASPAPATAPPSPAAPFPPSTVAKPTNAASPPVMR